MSVSSDPNPDLVRPPQQDRSRATLQRILEGTEELLQARLIEDITLGDLLKKSRVSVGAFYARFPNKESLIPCLYDRYDRQITEGVRRVLAPGRWQGMSLERRTRTLFRYTVRLYRSNRGLMRALTLHARTSPSTVTDAQRKNRADLYDTVAAMLLECRGEMEHPDPTGAVQFGLLMAGTTFREKILYDQAPHAGVVALDDRTLAGECARAFLAYVGCRGSWK